MPISWAELWDVRTLPDMNGGFTMPQIGGRAPPNHWQIDADDDFVMRRICEEQDE
jgi:hypothetical protein